MRNIISVFNTRSHDPAVKVEWVFGGLLMFADEIDVHVHVLLPNDNTERRLHLLDHFSMQNELF